MLHHYPMLSLCLLSCCFLLSIIFPLYSSHIALIKRALLIKHNTTHLQNLIIAHITHFILDSPIAFMHFMQYSFSFSLSFLLLLHCKNFSPFSNFLHHPLFTHIHSVRRSGKLGIIVMNPKKDAYTYI